LALEERIKAIGRKNIAIKPKINDRKSIKKPFGFKPDITNLGFTRKIITDPGNKDRISRGMAKYTTITIPHSKPFKNNKIQLFHLGNSFLPVSRRSYINTARKPKVNIFKKGIIKKRPPIKVFLNQS
jgi:hypothetical protein